MPSVPDRAPRIVPIVDLQLRDQVVLVIGGTGLIGSAVVARLHAEGATAIAASRHPGNDGIMIDAADEQSLADGVAEVIRRHGRIDALVVTAAPAAQTLDPSRSSDPDQVMGAIEAKAMVFLRAATAVIPTMKKAGYGRIVAISGQNAFLTGSITGSVRNAATIVVAENLADELANTGILVNAVSPGTVTTDTGQEVQPGRPGSSTPQQVADLVVFLCSPLSAVSAESIAVGHRVLGVTSL
ncbi:SDR family oxidoreductase [Microlunatus endophyticus]